MSLRLYIKQGQQGNPDEEMTISAPVTDGVAGDPLIHAGMHYGDGDSNQSTFVLVETTGSDLAPGHRGAGRRLTTVTEDATSCQHWIHRGRLNNNDFGRGNVPVANNAEQGWTSFDGNMELRGQAFTEAWVRPAETDYARLVALQAYMLNGPSSTAPVPSGDTHGSRASCNVTVLDSHLAKNANNVMMPATTYPIGTQPIDVVSDCATTAGKDFGVVIHSTEGSSASVTRSWKPASLSNLNDMLVEGALNSALLAIIIHNGAANSPTITYIPDPVSHPFDSYALTKYGEVDNTNGTTTQLQIEVYYLLNPPASAGSTGSMNYGPDGVDDHFSWGVLLLSGVTTGFIASDDSFIGTTNMSNPGTTTNDIAASTNNLIISTVGYTTQQVAAAEPVTTASDQTKLMGWDGSGVSPGQDQFVGGISEKVSTGGSTTDSWSVTGALGGAMTQWDLAIQGGGSLAVNCDDHLCLQYIVPTDLTTNPCAIRISDQISEYDPLGTPTGTITTAPIPDQGKYSNGDAGELLSAVAYIYQTPSGSGAVFSEHAATTDAYDYWRETVSDSLSLTPVQAEARADAYRDSKRVTHVSHQLSILVRPDQVHLVRAGMAIQIKGAAIMGEEYLGTWQTRRIADVIAQPEIDGDTYHYRLQLQLDRGQRKVPSAGGFGGAVGDPARATVASGTYAGQSVQQVLNTLTSQIGPLTTVGDMLYRGGGGSNTRLPIGPSNTHLRSDGTKPVWSPEEPALTNPMTTAGDMIRGGASGTPTRLALGPSNTVLSSDGTQVLWDTKTGDSNRAFQ